MRILLFALARLAVCLGACSIASPRPIVRKSPPAYPYAVDLRHLVQLRLQVRVVVPRVRGKQAVVVFPPLVPGIQGNLNFGQYGADFAAYDRQTQPLAVARQRC